MNARSLRNMLALLTLVSGASYTSAVAQTTTASTTTDAQKDSTEKLEKFEVTGSRIKRTDYETTAPVVNYTAADIETKGYTNIGDFIQSLPFNTGSSNSIYQTASFTRGASTANPRGLGSQRFLVLINGRRAVTYALINSGNRSVFDFNSLPAAAIESIDYLKDGASAIYGADAVTGVLNIKLKKNFSGLSLMGFYGNTNGSTSGKDSGVTEFSVVAGAGNGTKTRMMVAADFKKSNSSFIHDYGLSTTDYSGYAPKGINQNSPSNFPANVTLTRAQATALGLTIPVATATSWTFLPTGGQQQANPSLAGFTPAAANGTAAFIPNENRYNFADTYQLYPSTDYSSVFTQFEHDFTENIHAFAEVQFSDNNTYYAFTPGVLNFSTEGLTLPVNNPYNPFGIALTNIATRASFGPVRKFDTESLSANFLGGLRGTIFDKFDWESAVAYGFNEVTSVARNAIRASVYQAALNGTTRATAINPFGPSDNQTLLNGLFTSSTGSNKSESTGYDFSIGGPVFELPTGDIELALGGEFRKDKLTTNPDTAAYLGSGGGLPLQGSRNVTSAYAEMKIPFFKGKFGSAEGDIAARYEDYSDFGSQTKPKYGLSYTIPKNNILNVKLRGSYSESFQAPALGLLHASRTTAFTSNLLQDPLRPQDAPAQLRIITGGNPNLLPETAKTTYGGVVFDVPAVKDLSFTIDWFKFRINQVIVTPSSTYLLSAAGQAQFPNGIVRDNSGGTPGPILYLASVPSNNPAAYQIYRGWDLGVKYILRNTRVGDFQFTADATRTVEIGSDSGLGGGYFDNIGLFNNPKWRGNASTSWRYKDFGASVAIDYIGKYFNDAYTADGWGMNSYTIVSPQVTYSGFWNSKISLGVTNVLNNRPPFNGYETSSIDQSTYGAGAQGRFFYIRVRKDF